jgi:hypothetical protein
MAKSESKSILEASVESELIDCCTLIDWQCWKFVTPGRRGPPDRILLGSGGRVVFVELKTKGGRLFKWQKRNHKKLRALGFRVEVLWTKEQVRAFVPSLVGSAAKRLVRRISFSRATRRGQSRQSDYITLATAILRS